MRETLAKEYKREYFAELKSLLDKRQIIVICGLRRISKTDFMALTIADIEKNLTI